jgi:hypothetical protein
VKAIAIDKRLPWVKSLHDLDDARNVALPGPRMDALVAAGEKLGDQLRAGPRVRCVRTLPLTTLLYPTKYAFSAACRVPVPMVVMSHRALLIQVDTEDGVKNILFNPSVYEASVEAPYFRKLVDQFGERMAGILVKQSGTADTQLAAHGLSVEDIDVLAFDHFHVQDLRPLLGSAGVPGQPDQAGMFPNALLLAPKIEWQEWEHLHESQRAWYVADGKRGVPEDRVVLTDNDLSLGDGCLLLRTPGHTSGNQTLFCHAERGVFGCSENGTCVDNWAPQMSRIPGLAETARAQDLRFILNTNTPETAVQYTSMALERSLVDPLAEAPAFPQMFSSSEVTAHWMAPGVRPTASIGERDSGTPVSPGSRAAKPGRKGGGGSGTNRDMEGRTSTPKGAAE